MDYFRRVSHKIPQQMFMLVLMLVPFYGFLTVWAASLFGHYTLIRLWPEFALAVLASWALVIAARHKEVRKIFSTKLARLILAYLALSLVWVAVALWQGEVGLKAAAYGILLNTRPFIWLGAIWLLASHSAVQLKKWRPIVFVPFALVVGFALLQFFVLPPDFLRHFGYVDGRTIAPIQTINQDTSTVRAQSFLRGPNQLGAYMVLGTGFIVVAGWRFRRMLLALTASTLALIVSFSRSAWLGFVGMFGLVLGQRMRSVSLRKLLLTVAIVLFVCSSLLYVFRANDGLQNALFHVSENSTATTTSNSGHLSGALHSVNQIAHEPLGRGPGTAGPASVYNEPHPARISESYYLGVGQELGWVGLALFGMILYELFVQLRRSKTMLGRGVFITFFGLGIVNLFSYAWTDPTLAYLWWGLAGLVLGLSWRKDEA